MTSPASAQNSTKGFLTFRNCAVEFIYPEEWKNFIGSNSSDTCEVSDIEINFPQPSLSDKIKPRAAITVMPCCMTSEGYLTNNASMTKKMTLNEFVNQTINDFDPSFSIIAQGPISLAGNEAYKIVIGILDPAAKAVSVYSINETKLYAINYFTDPSDYDTYLPGVQKIVDSFKILVS